MTVWGVFGENVFKNLEGLIFQEGKSNKK